MDGMTNLMRREAARVLSQTAQKRDAIVTGYDPDHYMVKVSIQPEGRLTGWIPLVTPWAGNGWGLFAPPQIGSVVKIDYLEGDKESPVATGSYFNAQIRPLSCPSGEFWLVHKNGQFVKLLNDGTIASSGTWNHTGALNVVGNVAVTGNVTATGDITDQSATTAESMHAMRTKYNSHVHPGVTTGGGSTGTTTQTM